MPEERTLVTILFADVIDSTALEEELDPEDARLLMGRYYELARTAVGEHGGTLEKFIGDAIMAIFGLPQVHGDEAERALCAALSLRQAVASDELLSGKVQLRMGVNTGEVIATSNPEAGDFLVTGDAVNVAARLQQSANASEILVGERTARAVHGAFIFAEERSVQVKGKRQPLIVFPLERVCQKPHIERPPFVGRKQDLLQLNLLLERVLEEERPQLVSLIAPAGTGKSRLLDEFLAQLPSSTDFRIARARCLPYGQTLTYWPLHGLLEELLSAPPEQERVQEVFLASNYSPDDARRLTGMVLRTLGRAGEGMADRESMFIAWRLLIEALARQAPRIVIFEDLHWANDSLLDLVEQIIQLHTNIPLLLIALSRPELLDRRPTWGGGRQNFTSLALQPLTTKQIEALVTPLMPELASETRQLIIERSAGNPFFALELLRGLREQPSTEALVLPDTIHAAVLARLDLLARPVRQIVQVAAVINRPFSLTLLAAVLPDVSRPTLELALIELQARDMLVAVEQGRYVFRHVLIRDVAYNTLTRAERLRLHEQVALALEGLIGKDQQIGTSLIAYHYNEVVCLANQSVIRTNSTFHAGRALTYLRDAALAASFTGAFAEAQEYLEHAIQIAPEDELCTLYELLGDSMSWSRYTINAYEHALAQWRSGGSVPAITGARLLRKLLIQYTRGGAHEYLNAQHLPDWRAEAQRLAEEGQAEYELYYLRIVDCFMFWASDLYKFVDPGEGRRLVEEAVEYFARQNDAVALSEALDGYATYVMVEGDFQAGVAAAQRRLAIPGLPALERGDAISMLARAYMVLSQYEQSIAVVQQELAELRPGQPIVHLAHALCRAVTSAYFNGDWKLAEQFAPWLYTALNQSLYNIATCTATIEGFFCLFRIALARENQMQAGESAAILQRLSSDLPKERLVIARLVQLLLAGEFDSLALFEDLETIEPIDTLFLLVVCGEYNIPVPASILAKARSLSIRMLIKPFVSIVDLAEAFAAQDYPRMAGLIDILEESHYGVHAARMRLVLAQHTGSREQLARARPLLERLGDKQFLCKLTELEQVYLA